MTLEQKAEEYIEKNCKIWEEGELTVDEIVRLAYIAGAEEVKSDCDFALEGKDVEIKELKDENNNLLDVINNQDVKIADLESENAELKERYDKVDIIGYDALKNLTKATEIIKTLADDLSVYSGNYQKELLDAEQFLKEIEK